MPKAKKQAPAAVTEVAKKIANTPAKPKKGKANTAQVKEASKPIKKNSQASSVKSKASTKGSTQASAKSAKTPVSKRPSAQPKKPGNAYNFFCTEMQNQMKNMAKFKDMTFAQRSQVVAQSWGKLKEEQKSEYTKCALEDKKRFDKELKQIEKKGFFINKDGKDSRDLYKAPKGTSTEDQEMKDDSPKKKAAKADKEDRKSTVKKEEKKSDVCKPKIPLSAYIFFSIENRAKVHKDKPDLSYGDVYKQNAQDWKNVTESQLKQYEQLSKKDQERYKKELKEFNETGYFTNADGVNSKFMDYKHRVQEFELGTVLPKRPATVWTIYFTEQQNLIKSQRKEGEKYSVAENTKKISESWSKLTEQKKAKYEKLCQKDKERQEKQFADLRKNGFFTDENGVKSTDMKYKAKKIPVKKAKKQDAEAAQE